MARDPIRLAQWIALLVPSGLMVGALGSQYLGGLIPCEMCHWQRWPHYAAIIVALLSFAVPRGAVRFGLIALAALLIATSGAIGVFHAGVEYHWWQGITACSTEVTGGDPMEMLTAAIRKPLVRCDSAQWSLFGISLAGYNAILSLGGALVISGLLSGRKAG